MLVKCVNAECLDGSSSFPHLKDTVETWVYTFQDLRNTYQDLDFNGTFTVSPLKLMLYYPSEKFQVGREYELQMKYLSGVEALV